MDPQRDVPLVEFMYPLYLDACQVRVTEDNLGLCCCTCATYFQRQLTPLWVKLILHERSGPRTVSELPIKFTPMNISDTMC